MSYQTETRTIREGLFRFGQWFSLQNIQFSYYRDPIANLLCRGVVNDAMSKAFDVVEVGTEEELGWNDELQKVMDEHYSEFMQAIYWQRRDGRSIQVFMQKDSDLVNMAGAFSSQYRLYKDSLGRASKGVFTPRIDGYPGTKQESLKAEDDNFMELIVDRREKIGEGMSVLEPVWDVLFAIYMLVSHSAYFVARAGAGIKDVAIDESALTDTEGTSILSTLHTAFAEFGSASDVIIRPKTLGGQELNFDIKTVDSAVDFNRILDMYLTIISAHTGIPQSTLKGLVPGQLAGAVVNEASYFDYLRDLQEKYTNYCKWFVRQLNKHYSFIDEEDVQFDILFRVRQVISEEDGVAMTKSRLEVAQLYKGMGISTVKAFELAGIDGVAESDLREGIDQPIEFGNGQDDTESEEEEEEESEEE